MEKKTRTAEDYFNPDTYEVTDKVTGEILDVKIFIERASESGWQKSYVQSLCEYMGCADGAASKVLTHILKNKTQENLMLGTYQEIADKSKVSKSMVQRVFKRLILKKLVRNIRTGCHILLPKILCNGNKKIGAMVFRVWGETKRMEGDLK